ncbi:SMC-Scp complex subunit ScpB [Micromonospora fiedleri]|uniref:SMC-Scp complex subunit ScpB n=1 Tax=Micromonospora fiedleri TaxID=1157498 RepID=A0ABS1UVM7_9ACTN|nr:SMC-Scp complex subunit ScpB [Micromonospora fiedleri]MBL6280436.1 SMC-Scp complex subunit ScpB [Micromonospora fiedleri]
MSHEERRDSLADQAAAWIPPWQRPAPPAETATTVPAQARPTDDAVDDTDEPGPQSPTEPPQQGAGDNPLPAGDGQASGLRVTRPAGEQVADEQAADASLALPVGEQAADEQATDASLTLPAVEPGADEQAAGVPVTLPVGEPGADGQAAGERVGAAVGDAGGGRKQRSGRAKPAPEPTPLLDDTELRGALEAILLVVDEPVSELTLAQVLEQPAERIGPMLDDIAAGYTAAGHGFDLRRAAGGWRLYTRPEYASYVERFILDGQSVRLTQAALETLAVVAYKQPVTRSRISAIRGVNCDGVIRTLVSRGLVEECGTESDSGAYLYRTTTMFLEKLGLNSLDDLPPLAPFLPDDVEELADASR